MNSVLSSLLMHVKTSRVMSDVTAVMTMSLDEGSESLVEILLFICNFFGIESEMLHTVENVGVKTG